jgi:predicted O-methyltransferase YrrM
MLQLYGVKYPKKSKPLRGYALYMEKSLQPTKAIQTIYASGKVKTETGEVKKLTAAVDPYEGYFLYSVIKENKFKNVLEIGMANGMSALYICSALKEISKTPDRAVSPKTFSPKDKELSPHLISIDPFQKDQWENTGLQTLRTARLLKYHTLIEEVDYLALPKLLREVDQNKVSKFDLILIDGNHLFDYTVLDFFYTVKLLNIGGMIVLDDIRHKNTGKAYKYIKTNYKNLQEIKNAINDGTQAAFIKMSEDTRSWDFHVDF